jgi:hypothetical protein
MKPLQTILFVLFSMILHAQVAINTDGSSPDNSAMMDIKSNSKGLLIPRLTTTQRTVDITSPVDGLMVYDTDTKSIWMYRTGTGAGWKELTVTEKTAFKVYRSTDVTISASPVSFDSKEFDDGNNFVSAFGYFLAPSDGVYHFEVNTTVVNSGAGYNISLYKTPVVGPDSRIYTNIIRPASVTFPVSTSVSYTFKLLANEKIRVWIETITGTATVKAGADQSSFSGYKLY